MTTSLDRMLVERIDQRLRACGDEVPCLRVTLLRALIEAAALAGDHDEASALRVRLEAGE